MRQIYDKPGPHTWSDFVALPEGDPRELIDGHLVEIEMAEQIHDWSVFYLNTFLGSWALKHGFAGAGSTYKVKISDQRGVMPDLQLYPQEDFGRPENRQGYTSGRTFLAVEVISPSSRSYDRVTKLEYYRSVGVREYWIVDTDAQRIERYVLRRSGYVLEDQVAGRADFTPKSMRGLKIPLGPLWDGPPKKKRR